MQRITILAKRDAERNATTAVRDSLAAMGSSGTHEGNMSRDFLRHVPTNRLAQLHHLHVPVRHKLLGRGRVKYPFLFPHEVFASIYHNYPAAFFKVIAPPGECEKFWAQVKGVSGLHLICVMNLLSMCSHFQHILITNSLCFQGHLLHDRS